MSLQRYEPSAPSLITDERYLDRLPALAKQLAASSMCPDTWRFKPGDPDHVKEQKVADLCVIGMSLAELDLRMTVNTLPQCYVVHGRPAFMAQLLIALAARHGCQIVPLDEESDDKSATVKVLGKDGQWHHVTVTMADAVKAGWDKRNPNYKTMPAQMLMARACTKAVGLHCPEAKFALPGGNLAEREPVPEAPEHVEDRNVIDQSGPEEAEADSASGRPVDPAMIPSSQAKRLLIEAFEEIPGVDGADAMAAAAEVWKSHGLGKDPISQETLGLLLAEARGGTDDGVVDGEVVYDDEDERPFE